MRTNMTPCTGLCRDYSLLCVAFFDRFAETLKDFLASGRLPRRVAEGHRSEMKEAARRCTAMREVCFGSESPATKEAQEQAYAVGCPVALRNRGPVGL